LVHEHNVGLHEFERDYRFARMPRDDGSCRASCATFQGFRRRHGKTGTRNYIGILNP
jgi:altronate hydrolase